MAETQTSSGEKPKFESVANRSPTSVTSALKGMQFPATLPQLIAHAKNRGAHKETLDVIEELPEGDYQQMADVTHNLGRRSR